MAQKSTPMTKAKYSSLEIANQMFKDAWLIKRTLFQKRNPNLSSADLNAKTADYFSKLKDN